VIHDIWKATAGRAIIVTDVGQHQMWTAQYYKVAEPGTFITSGGLGTMGFGVPAAIGAKMARPDREVWAIVGDGGFQMTQAELQTIVQENVKINIAIINNGYLGMVRQCSSSSTIDATPHADVVARLRQARRRARSAGRAGDAARETWPTP
jgi:acetolactate synthase-1/2/3 large subunit